eukprot:jgi/Tetstr1/444990/TSEL_032799.t1
MVRGPFSLRFAPAEAPSDTELRLVWEMGPATIVMFRHIVYMGLKHGPGRALAANETFSVPLRPDTQGEPVFEHSLGRRPFIAHGPGAAGAAACAAARRRRRRRRLLGRRVGATGRDEEWARFFGDVANAEIMGYSRVHVPARPGYIRVENNEGGDAEGD